MHQKAFQMLAYKFKSGFLLLYLNILLCKYSLLTLLFILLQTVCKNCKFIANVILCWLNKQ